MERQIARITALIFAGLSLTSMVFAGALERGPMQERYNPATQDMLRVPGVVGMYEQDAMAVLQQSGVAAEISYSRNVQKDLAGKEGTVINQDPGAGGVSMLGSSVMITVYWPPSMGVEPGETDYSGQYGNDGGQWGEQPAQPPYEEPEPQWGDGGQDNGGWMPPPAPSPQPYEASETPPDPPPSVPMIPVPQARTPVGTQQPSGLAPVVTTQVEPTITQAGQQESSPPPVIATPEPELVTPVNGQHSIGPEPVVATPVEPTATRANQQQSNSNGSFTVEATAVFPSATAVTQAESQANQNQEATSQNQQSDGSCRSWYAIAVDITAEAQRIAKELGCAAVQPPAMWQACIKHIDKIGKWNAYNLQLKKRWNRLVKTTSWAAIGPRDLTLGKTHTGRLMGTTGRTFITPVPVKDERVNITLTKKAGKSRTSVTVCSYMPGGDRIKEWYFESPSGNENKGQLWEASLTDMEGKLMSIHLDGKSVADTFQYSIFLKGD